MALRTLADVLARSGPCITVSEDATIHTLANALVKHRIDAVSVLSATDARLCGIATARDVAKCMSRNLNLDSTNVSLVMTPNPVTLPPTETPANALSLMRQGRFRHIPVTSEDSVLGIVDVLSLAYDAITRLQLSYSMIPSRRGYDLLRAARETIDKPTLRHIIERAPLTTMKRHDTVAAACELIVTKHIAAIVVVDDNGVLDGIFTCTDIVKRVVSPGKDPAQILLADVMTSSPDCASPDFTILESLQRMQACGFRHLPVVDDHSRVVIGLVDVLQLASDTLLDLNTATARRAASGTVVSTASVSSHASDQFAPPATTADVPGPNRTGLGRGLVVLFGSLFSNSFAQNGGKAADRGSANGHGGVAGSKSVARNSPRASKRSSATGVTQPVEVAATRRHYGYLASNMSGRSRHARADIPLASFKFQDVNGDFRRIKVPMELEKGDFDLFVLDVRRRYAGAAGSSTVGTIKIKYVDEDGDAVLIANDDDLASCFEDVVDVKGKTIQLKVEEVEGVSGGSKIQSPVSSAPSSMIGSPGQASSASSRYDVGGGLQPSVEPPPIEHEVEVAGRATGVYRTTSRRLIHTPSTLRASEGHRLMLDQRIDEAIVAFTEAIELDSDNARALGERGAARLINGSSVEAEEDYRKAIVLVEKSGKKGDMTYQMCLVGLVECLIDQRRYEEAVVVARDMEAEWGNSGCTDAFRDELENASNAAREALESGDYGDAMSCYTNALRVEAGFLQLVAEESARASLRLGRAKCYKMMEDFDMALEDYEAAVGLEQESVAGHKGCGKCFEELEQWDRALEAYERAWELDGGDEEVGEAIKTIKAVRPDPMKTKKEEIAKLGALLGGMKLPGKK